MNFIKPSLILSIFLILISCSKEAEIVVQYKLTVSANPTVGGTVTPGSSSYNKGQIVNLLATPSAEYVFKDWSGSLSGSTNPSPLTMDMDKSVVGNFEKRQYPLSLTIEGQGTVKEEIAVVAPQSQYPSGTTVKLTATPNTGWNFSNWSGDLSGSNNPETILIDKTKSITVVFKQVPDKDGDGIPDDKDLDNNTRKGVPVDANGVMLNPVYLDKNGVTIKAYDWAIVGDKGNVYNIEYKIINLAQLRDMIVKGEDYSKIVTTKITDFSYLFKDINGVKNSITSWDVSNVTSFYYTFNKVIIGSTSSLNYWDTKSAIDLSFMFSETRFNEDITKWNVSKVKKMNGMFYFNLTFNQPIGNWDVSSVIEMATMFSNSQFNQPIGNWDVGKVTRMYQMFWGNTKFNQPIGTWNVSNVSDMNGMFTGTTSFNQSLSNWDVGNVKTMVSMFTGSQFNLSISDWNVSKVTDMESMFSGSKFNQSIENWNISNVKSMMRMFEANIYFNQDLSKWKVDYVSNCVEFARNATNWTLPKPKFTNCTP